MEKRQSDIRKAKKEALFFKELSRFFLRISLDDPSLSGIHISSVKLSSDKSVCSVFFYSEKGEADFKDRLPDLVLYKPSVRKAISQSIPSRYTPQLIFKYDTQFEKQRKLDTLFDKLKLEDKL